jgi:hypothetical protein
VNSKNLRRSLLSICSTLVNALLLIGCQTTPHRNPPPRPIDLGSKHQEPSLPPAQLRKTIPPAAWKAEADRWLGVKYRKGGLDRNGIDCSGLAGQMYLSVKGIAIPRTAQDQSRCGNLVFRTDLRPGDLLFFITLKDKQVDHVGYTLAMLNSFTPAPQKGWSSPPCSRITMCRVTTAPDEWFYEDSLTPET